MTKRFALITVILVTIIAGGVALALSLSLKHTAMTNPASNHIVTSPHATAPPITMPLGGASGTAPQPMPPPAPATTPPAPTTTVPPPSTSTMPTNTVTPTTNGIPQGNAGDGDPDNNGAPSDGDGNV